MAAEPDSDGPGPADPVTEVEGDELFARAMSLAQGGDLVRAEQYIVAAMQQGYPEERALPTLLRVCVAASRMRVALGYAEPYLRRNPDDWPLRYLVASIHAGLGDLAAAQSELERVVEGAPDRPKPRYLLAKVLLEQGEIAAAEGHMRHYLTIAPEGEYAREIEDRLARVSATEGAEERELTEADPAPEQEAQP